MDETREGIEYQRVSAVDIKQKNMSYPLHHLNFTTVSYSTCKIHSFFVPQEIDDLLSGSLTQEDEDAVLQELEEMTQVV